MYFLSIITFSDGPSVHSEDDEFKYTQEDPRVRHREEVRQKKLAAEHFQGKLYT